MKIAVLGSNGFVGRNIVSYLKDNTSVIPVTRKDFNLLNPLEVKSLLQKEMFDVIVNCAVTMTDDLSLSDTRNNLGIFMNFYNNRHLFGKFINTASGAEFDRLTDINCAKEETVFNHLPADSYGFGKNIVARLCVETNKFYNVRIFNCFGNGELKTRIFPRLLSQGYIDISNDRYFDYFSIQDLQKLIKHCIENDWPYKDVNAVYKNKLLISEAVCIFAKIHNIADRINVINHSNNNYTGCGERLENLKIELAGLEQGFKDY